MNENINKFLLIQNDVIVWFSKIESVVYKNNKRLFSINKDGAKILYLCNGTMTLKDIVKRLTIKNEHYNDNLRKAFSFIETLYKMGVIYFSEFPSHVPREKYKKGSMDKIYPFHITLELTNRCNLKCRYCYNNSSILNRDELIHPIELLKELKDNGVWSLEFSGGEPLLHSKIEDILYFALNNFGMIGIITNGTLIDERICEIVKDFSDRVIFQVCLDSLDHNELEKITNVKNSYKKIIKGINFLKKNDLVYRIGMVIDDPKRIEKIEDVLKFAIKEGASAFVANIVLNFGRGENQANKFKEEDYKKFWEKIEELTVKYPKMFRTEIFDKMGESKNCGAGSRALTINWNREIKMCVLDELVIDKLDNKRRYRDFISEKQELFEIFAKLGTPNEKICGKCNFLNYCYKCVVRGVRKSKEIGIDKCSWTVKEMEKIKFITNGGCYE